DLLIHRGNEQHYEVGVSGGSEKTKAYFSVGYNRVKGLFKFDHTSKYTGRLNVEHILNSILKVGMNSQITYYDISTERDPLNEANKIIPLGSPYDSSGQLQIYPENGPQLNPLVNEAIPHNYADNTNTTRLLTTAYVQLDPAKGLSLRSNFSANLDHSREGIFNGRYSLDRNGSDPRSQYNTSRSLGILWENILTFKKQFGNNDLTFTGVTSYQSGQSDNGAEQGDGQLIPAQSYYGLGNATSGLIASTGYEETKLVSFTGRINYAWKSKYLLTLTGRTDGSSKLAPGNKWAFFPSAAAAWRISQEPFLQQSKTISNLKLRASYGVTGNDPLDAYSIQSLLTNISFA
ncbi:MAG TPA: SusC/RagA family protein, partial [Chitinophagaceae bacterium]|nr:SusC/RagA family protein [Chitinophagaceae bacterium]